MKRGLRVQGVGNIVGTAKVVSRGQGLVQGDWAIWRRYVLILVHRMRNGEGMVRVLGSGVGMGQEC